MTDLLTDKRLFMDQWIRDKKLYTLYYLPVYVRGEPIRMLLTHAGVDFEDKIISFEDWPKWKPEMPGGVLPVLEFTTVERRGQTLSILRYLGIKFGYYPTDHDDAWCCDSLMDGLNDILPKIYGPFLAKPEDREAMYPALFDDALPKLLDICEQRLEGKTYLCGDKLSIADFFIGGIYTNYITNDSVGFAKEKWQVAADKYPNYKAYGARFAEANKKRLDNRPAYPV